MTKTYLVNLNDGIKFRTEDLDLNATILSLNSRTVAIKLNRKGIQKQLIIMIADSESKNQDGKNLMVTVANEMFYLTVDNPDEAIDKLINDVNNHQWVEVGGGLVFNRNAFQYAEVHNITT